MPTPPIETLVRQVETLLQEKNFLEARRALHSIIKQEPCHFSSLVNLGAIALLSGQRDIANRWFHRATAAAPQRHEGWSHLAMLAAQSGQTQDLVSHARAALVRHPGDAQITQLLGEALSCLAAPEQAAAALKAAYFLDSSDPVRRWRWGLAVLEAGDIAEALPLLMTALGSGRLSADDLLQAGIAFYNQGLHQQARDFFDLTLLQAPNHVVAAWYRMTSLLPQVATSEQELETQRLLYRNELVALGQYCLANPAALSQLARAPLPMPFYLPYQGRDDRALQDCLGKLLSDIMANHPKAPAQSQSSRLPRGGGHRLRIGIVSGFFRLHSNWKIPIKGWLEGIDRGRFEIYGYYTDGQADAQTERARELCDRFVQGPRPIEGWIDAIRNDQPDLLLYPEIGMDSMASRLAAMRLAPVQCTSWGHPETSGLPTIDYFLSSDLMEPEEADQLYSESLIRLPNLSFSYQPDHLAEIESMDRRDWDLSPDDCLYWCCQNLSKYLPRFDGLFAQIARRHPAARFLFIEDPSKRAGNQVFRQRLHDSFAQHHLDSAWHCRFLPRLSQRQFLGVTRICDVFLDSVGWSGCNSVLDAVALDLPVVTLPGRLMRSRHALAILTRLGCIETVARNEEEFVTIAAQLGQDRIARAAIRKQMAAGRRHLFEDPAPAQALATFFEQAIVASERRPGQNAA